MREKRTRSPVEFRRLVILAVVVALPLAGCSTLPGAETGTQTSAGEPNTTQPTTANATTTQTATPPSPPSLAEKGVDVNATWNRTRELVNVTATRPDVAVSDTTPPFGFGDTPDFFTAIVGPPPNETSSSSAFYDPQSETVVVYPGTVMDRSAAELESLLVHEFVHAIQYQRGWTYDEAPASAASEPKLRRAYFEGMADYVRFHYEGRYLDVSSRTDRNRLRADATTYELYRLAQYVYGPTYFENRLAGPGSLSQIGGRWPASWEQVLHDTDESPGDLTVEDEYTVGRWTVENHGRQGELVTRAVLRDELTNERATAAASGWGSDELHKFGSGWRDESGYVWVHRWDTADDADEFEAAMGTYLDGRRSETDEYGYEFQRLTPETTVVVTGERGFVDSATVTADSNATVTVSVPD